MTASELNRAVAEVTGEDVRLIEKMGFSLVDDEPPSENDVSGQIIDWDDLPEAA